MTTYAVIFEQAENNWAAYVPDLPGCISTGKTIEEIDRNIREAIKGHLKTLRDLASRSRAGRALQKQSRCPRDGNPV